MKTIKIPFDFKIAEQEKNTENGLITFETRCGYALDILSIDIINDSYKIAALVKDKYGKQFVMLYNDKAEPTNKDSSMDILMNVPYYYSFKEGDVIAYDNGLQNVMSIFKKNVDLYTYERYAIFTESDGLEINSDVNMIYKDSRKANEEEIAFFISKLKEDGSEKAIELINRFFPNNAVSNFSIFDKVLVKNSINDEWEPNFLANILIEKNNKIRYKCIGGNIYNYCIPYSDSLKIEDESFKMNNFEYVDLGLPSGTKWAKCNVGADNEEDPGLYFQYGGIHGAYRNEIGIDGKKSFSSDKSDYDFWNDGDTEKLSRPFLSLEDDAAHVNMGGKWRMPTKEDMIEECRPRKI